jgi:hypothetical protein
MHDAPWLVGCSFLSQNSCSAGRVPAGAERLISWEEAGSTRPLASGFSVHGVTGQSLPGLTESTGGNERLAEPCSCLGSVQWVYLHT